jgi:oligoribonuclease (3'-5' exoribonuclease)
MCFIDLEMTDPDPRRANLAEIAVFIVSGDLSEKICIADFVIRNTNLPGLITNEAVIDRFVKNGLWEDM